jgi:hypothetical protein
MSHLWEVKHPYYCEESNYYAPGNDQPMKEYKNWADFIGEEGYSDLDLNLVFRWDWREGADWDLPEHRGDINYRDGKLLLFIIGQRKGLYRWVEIEVCRADESAVIEYLRPRWERIKLIWEPLP